MIKCVMHMSKIAGLFFVHFINEYAISLVSTRKHPQDKANVKRINGHNIKIF